MKTLKHIPCFVTIRKEAKVDPFIDIKKIYTAVYKGWDVRKGGVESYYLTEIDLWIPVYDLVEINGVLPN